MVLVDVREENRNGDKVEGAIMADLIDTRPGGGVRVTAPGMIKGLETPALPGYAFEMLNYMNSMGEKRTGVSSWQQGPDAADMKYQTSGAVSNVQTASESKINLINTVFAQTGIKRLGQILLQIVCENYTQPFFFRLRGNWVECDPRSWNSKMDCEVNTGLGVGETEARLAKLVAIMEYQKSALQQGAGMMVTPANLYNSIRDFVKTADIAQEGRYFTDPGAEAKWPEPEPDFETQVKMQESRRRSEEDLKVDNQDTMKLAVQASQQEQIAQFRYDELVHKAKIEAARLANQREIASLQMRAQIESAMVNHNHQQG